MRICDHAKKEQIKTRMPLNTQHKIPKILVNNKFCNLNEFHKYDWTDIFVELKNICESPYTKDFEKAQWSCDQN